MARTENKITFVPGEKFSLKDHLFNKTKIQQLGREIASVYPDFNQKQFVADVMKDMLQLELKARIELITDYLFAHLPSDYTKAVAVILQALPDPLDSTKSDDDFGDFIYEPYNTYISSYGCNTEYFDTSLQTLQQTTQRFSAEFALRKFIQFDEEKTLTQVILWSRHENYHVRRLASEGIRPNLPWGGKIQTDPRKIVAVLDNLYHDHTRYVVRSVANNLNDISKIDYTLVLKTLKRWQKENKQNQKEFDYLVRHALRSQIKSGESTVMQFLGYKPDISHTVAKVQYKKQITVGEKQEINLDIISRQSGKYMIDYIIFFQKKDGSLSGKTFKIKDVFLEKGESLQINKKHLFRNMSTKQLYPGQHAWCLQINGVQGKKHEFDLII